MPAQEDPEVQSAKSEILGEWVREDCSNCKLVFTENMTEKYYIDGELIWKHQYDISRVCSDKNKVKGMDDKLMLLNYDENGEKISCDIIQAINNNNSNILSITTENQGKNIVYKRF